MNSILIVDDCAELRSLFRYAFEGELGLRCIELASFSEVKEHEKEVLLCRVALIDINLGPGQPDGVAIHDWLRAHAFQGTMFFFTGHAADSPIVRRAAETRVPILEKPMAVSKLLTIIKDSIAEIERKSALA